MSYSNLVEDQLREEANRLLIDLFVHIHAERDPREEDCKECKERDPERYAFCRIGSIFHHIQTTQMADPERFITLLQSINPEFFEASSKLWRDLIEFSQNRRVNKEKQR